MRWLRRELKDAAEKGQRVLLFNHFPVLPAGAVHNLWNDQELIDPLSGEHFVRETHQFAGESFSLGRTVGFLCFDLEPPRLVCFLVHFACYRSGVKAWTRPSISLRTIYYCIHVGVLKVASGMCSGKENPFSFILSMKVSICSFDKKAACTTP